MKRKMKAAAVSLACVLAMQCPASLFAAESAVEEAADTSAAEEAEGGDADSVLAVRKTDEMLAIESALDLSNMSAEWSLDESAGAWTMSPVTAVTNPEIEEEQGVSVCVPAAYVKGIDTDGDGEVDVTEGTANGTLVIDYDASVTSTNGQVYTAATAPVIVNTGAAGYSEQQNQTASSTYAAEGYINVACGNRGKQSTLEDGTYTGDAPSCLVDQKNAVRFVKYNILLGNLPGSVDYFVSTGGSGGGAHAAMLAATSDNPDFYDYEIEAGAVGVYQDEDGNYITSVTVDGTEKELSDGMWGCMAYSAITSLAEADMAMAFEYYLDVTYSFKTDFQKTLAEHLAAEYMEYINAQDLSVEEDAVGFDLNGDGDTEDTVELTIEYDAEGHADTNGYYGAYLDLYLSEFEESLNAYLEGLAYTDDWTWFDADGNALSDEEVAAMTTEDRALAFIEGRYAKGSTGSGGDMMGGPGGMMGGPGGMMGDPDGMDGGFSRPEGMEGGFGGPGGMDGGFSRPEGMEGGFGGPDGNAGGPPDMAMSGAENGSFGGPEGDMMAGSDDMEGGFGESDENAGSPSDMAMSNPENGMGGPEGMEGTSDGMENNAGEEEVGTPDAGTTQSATGSGDSSNYASYEEMLAAYQADIAEVESGDEYGNNIVELYNPLNYIGAEGTENPVWTRILMGASEGDISMMNSLNLEIAWLNAGTDAEIEWQWNGGHVPSEIFGDSLALYVDMMYGKYVDGAAAVEKAAPEGQTANGTATEATGTDISSWVGYDGESGAAFSLADAAAYRTAGASKAIPGFDVIDYGQEDYVFGSDTADARHWDKYVLKVLEENQEELAALFNS